jgi:hypothetical protein
MVSPAIAGQLPAFEVPRAAAQSVVRGSRSRRPTPSSDDPDIDRLYPDSSRLCLIAGGVPTKGWPIESDRQHTVGVQGVRSGRSRQRLVLVAGVAVVVALVAGIWLFAKGWDIAKVLALAAVLVGLPGAAAAVMTIVDRLRLSPEKLAAAARKLADEVRKQEGTELKLLIADTGRIRPANVEFVRALVCWRTDGGDEKGSLLEIESYYRRKLHLGRLVVLGEAGAGKTVLAIQLIRDLAARIEDTPLSPGKPIKRVRVPVRLSLPAFDPTAGENSPDDIPDEQVAKRLMEWLAGHLVTVYGLAEKTAAVLVHDGWVLPVLDGLDEMDIGGEPPRRAMALLRAVNHLGEHPMVLTCRTERYAELTGYRVSDPAAANRPPTGPASPGTGSLGVQDATHIVIQPLTVHSVIDYLTRLFPDPADSSESQPQWRPVVNWLDADPAGPLATAFQSPLRLFLAIAGYSQPDMDPTVLTRYTNTDDLDDHLFALLIPAVTEQHRRLTGQGYSASDVQRWLTRLAHHLRPENQAGKSASDLRMDQLWTAAGGYLPRYVAAAMLTAVVAAAVLAIDLLYLFPWGLDQNVFSTTAAMWGVGLVAATAWGSLRRSTDLRRIDLRALRTTAGRRRLAAGLIAGLGGGLVAGLATGLATELTLTIKLVTGFGFMLGSAVGIGFGLAFGLTFGLETRPEAIDLPRRLVSQGLVHTTVEIIAWLTGSLVFGAVIGRMSEFTFGYSFGPTDGLGAGLALGLALGVFNIARAPWPRYTIACLLLAMRRDLPLRPAKFLDWAYKAGLMRLSGIAVQFRHQKFQQWLTTHGDETDNLVVPEEAKPIKPLEGVCDLPVRGSPPGRS